MKSKESQYAPVDAATSVEGARQARNIPHIQHEREKDLRSDMAAVWVIKALSEAIWDTEKSYQRHPHSGAMATAASLQQNGDFDTRSPALRVCGGDRRREPVSRMAYPLTRFKNAQGTANRIFKPLGGRQPGDRFSKRRVGGWRG